MNKQTTQRLVEHNVKTHVFTEQASRGDRPEEGSESASQAKSSSWGPTSGLVALAAQLMALIGL